MNWEFPLLPAWMRWLAVLVIAGFIFYASIVTVPPDTAVDKLKLDPIPLDKWRHFVAYAALTPSLGYATADWNLEPKLAVPVVVIPVALYGIGVEAGQSLTANRYFSTGDIYANLLGVVIASPWFYIKPKLDFVSVTALLENPE